ncbi:hypothetical protein OSB04_012981 [Centaurea solstitialis]|uniref:Uncharacterized protein n=1 Tax=Centaurea solstitialis TaxID=347529 RepID=A0AA38WEI2_9ASTR|nr:hypothetical protein OSB04_012981 [Centaurea solstitialis]
MEGIGDGIHRYGERRPLGTEVQIHDKDYKEPPAAPLFESVELLCWSFYRATIAEFVATFLLYISLLTFIQVSNVPNKCSSIGTLGISWAFGGMMFALVYCTADISDNQSVSFLRYPDSGSGPSSGGHINPAVTFGLFVGRKLLLTRALLYMVMQCCGAIRGALVKGFEGDRMFNLQSGGANVVDDGYTHLAALGAEIIGTFVLVYTVFSATDAKFNARESHVPVLAPLPIGFAVFLVHLATLPITRTGINPARSLASC